MDIRFKSLHIKNLKISIKINIIICFLSKTHKNIILKSIILNGLILKENAILTQCCKCQEVFVDGADASKDMFFFHKAMVYNAILVAVE